MAYIRTASAYESPIIFIQIERDGKISKETFCSVYPRACGMYFNHKNNDFAVTLSDGRFIPPPEGWRGTIFYPLYDKDEDENEEYDDEDDDEDEYSDDGYEYDDDGYKNKGGAKPPQEDINELYYHMLRNDTQGDDSYDDDDFYDNDE